MFPDAITARGTKHLNELIKLVAEGHDSVIFFLVQRNDATHFKPATHIDSKYAKTLEEASKKGVKVLVYQANVSPEKIEVEKPLPFSFN